MVSVGREGRLQRRKFVEMRSAATVVGISPINLRAVQSPLVRKWDEIGKARIREVLKMQVVANIRELEAPPRPLNHKQGCPRCSSRASLRPTGYRRRF